MPAEKTREQEVPRRRAVSLCGGTAVPPSVYTAVPRLDTRAPFRTPLLGAGAVVANKP